MKQIRTGATVVARTAVTAHATLSFKETPLYRNPIRGSIHTPPFFDISRFQLESHQRLGGGGDPLLVTRTTAAWAIPFTGQWE